VNTHPEEKTSPKVYLIFMLSVKTLLTFKGNRFSRTQFSVSKTWSFQRSSFEIILKVKKMYLGLKLTIDMT
jgi:hypothetical protein